MIEQKILDYIDSLTYEDMIELPISFEKAMSFEFLYKAYLKCKRGVMWKDSVIAFSENSIDQIEKLSTQIQNGTYKLRNPHTFIVYSPKKRNIVSMWIGDRVVQRSLCDYIIYPAMTKKLIYANTACQKGKGTDCARNLLKTYLHKIYYENNDNNFYCLQIDIKGYYPNMRHDYVEYLFEKDLDTKSFSMVKQMLNAHYPGEAGYNPGSQLIQIAGICCLNEIDHYCKEQLHCRFYIRYMDDIIILSRDKKFLESALGFIIYELDKIGFEVNLKKTSIYHQNEFIKFLGFKYKLTETGKEIILINGETVKRARKHWINIGNAITTNKYPNLTNDKLTESIQTFESYSERATSSKALNNELKEFLMNAKNNSFKKSTR